MGKALIALTLGWMLLLPPAAPAQEEDVFRNEAAGFSITRPSGWVYWYTRKEDPLPTAWKLSPSSLVTMAPRPEVENGAGAVVGVMFGPLEYYEGMSPRVVLRKSILRPEGARTVEAAYPVNISGRDAAMVREAYVTHDETGRSVEMTGRTWVVFGERYVFFIGMTDRAENPEVPEAVFRAILDSIRIGP